MIKVEVYQNIKNAIDFGQILPGEHLTETSLSKKFKCSRAPIREALNRLEREGFITLVPNHGALVNKNSPQEIEDFYKLLELLEGQAIEWATPNLHEKDIKKLSEINSAMKRIPRDDSAFVEKWSAMNSAFHKVIWAQCGNQKMGWIMEEIILRITRYRYTFLITRNADYYHDDHDLIIQSIRNRDAKEARKHMVKHVARGKTFLKDYFMSNPKAELHLKIV